MIFLGLSVVYILSMTRDQYLTGVILKLKVESDDSLKPEMIRVKETNRSIISLLSFSTFRFHKIPQYWKKI